MHSVIRFSIYVQYEMFFNIQQEDRNLKQSIDLSGYLDESWNNVFQKLLAILLMDMEKRKCLSSWEVTQFEK